MRTPQEIIQGLEALPVRQDGILVIQSSFKALGPIEGGRPALIAALIERYGAAQTIIMPAYNFTSWTNHGIFDVLKTPSEVGGLAEAFRLAPGVRRSVHPIHSLAIVGKRQAELCSIHHEDSFGEDSIFVKLLEYNAIYCTLGLGTEQPFLPCHLTETRLRVPYRKKKSFPGEYADEAGNKSNRIYSFAVRRRDMAVTPVYPAHVIQYEMGAVKDVSFHGTKLFYAMAKDYDESLAEIIRSRPEMFE